MHLINVINTLLKIKDTPEKYKEEYYSLPLTGSFFMFSSYDLVYLLLEFSEEFNIKFEKDDVENYKFNTIDDIIVILSKKLNDHN